jgi:peptidoglycan/LPS O-acetylase OafA/YrhL
MVAGLVPPQDDRHELFASIAQFVDPTIGYLLKFSLFDVFFNYIHHLTYIGPLWSMHVELFGSIIVFSLLYCLRDSRHRTAALAAAAVAVYVIGGHWYALFIVGMLLADFFAAGRVIPPQLAIVLLLFGAGIPLFWNEDPSLVAASAALLTIGAVYWLPLRSFLSNDLSRWLGAISFPLYLLHGAVMMVLGAPLIVHFGGSLAANFALQTLTVLLSFGAAVLFRPIDALSINVSRRIGELAANNAFGRRSPAAS